MTAKTYKLEQFKQEDEERYVASAKDIRFLPASRIRIDRFNGELFAEFFLVEKTNEGWLFCPKKAKVHGSVYFVILA